MMPERTALEAQIQRLAQRIAILDRFPAKDPYRNGTVLRFKLNLPSSGTIRSTTQRYTYIGFRLNGRWYVTGKEIAGGWSWSQFVAFLGDRLHGELVEYTSNTKVRRDTDRIREAAAETAKKLEEIVEAQSTKAAVAPTVKDLFQDMCSAYGAMTMYRPSLDRIIDAASRAIAGNTPDRQEWWAAKRRFDALYHPVNRADPERSTES